mmetsp:Transcript_670/g.1379  ORF Transcript_670/g.1379 Transcript_670/m.1379 type:complete len:457 (+) Transcript_670:119-1489(+)
MTRGAYNNSLIAAIQASSGLKHVITKALIQVGVGGDECGKLAKTIEENLASFYIRTPKQLKDALDKPEVLEQLVSSGGCIKGLLLPAMRDELNHVVDDVSAQEKISDKINPTKPAKKPMNKPLLRKFDVARVDVTHLADIDQISQTFYARVFIILRIKNGALDNDLTQEFEGFPFDEHDRPTFRPSAKWYLDQIDFPNGKDIHTIDSKVTRQGNNLQLIKRVEGYFFERFDLHNFPFDEQNLTVTVSANCAMEGPVPVVFFVPVLDGLDDPPAQLGADTVNFALGDIWDLGETLSASVTTIGANSSRRFPAVNLRANVKRHSNFIMLNAAIPVSSISFLSLTTFFVPPEDTADRLELSITILLTSVTLKYATNSYLPMISYMTLIDKFTLLCTFVIFVVCLCHTILGFLYTWAEVNSEVLDLLNRIFLGAVLLVWGGVQLWFLNKQRVLRKPKSIP